MKFNIYNRYNKPTEVDTEDKEIRSMEVIVINGNELVWINYKGASESHISYPYGEENHTHYCYIVYNRSLKDWIKMEKDEIPTGYSIGEYRLEKFTGKNGKT